MNKMMEYKTSLEKFEKSIRDKREESEIISDPVERYYSLFTIQVILRAIDSFKKEEEEKEK